MFKVDMRLMTDANLTARAAHRNGRLGRPITATDLPTDGRLAELYVHLESFGSALSTIYCGRCIDGKPSATLTAEQRKVSERCYSAHSRLASSLFQLMYPGKRDVWLERRKYIVYDITAERRLSGLLYLLINGLLGDAYGDANSIAHGIHADMLNAVCRHYFRAMGVNLTSSGRDNASKFNLSLDEWSVAAVIDRPATTNVLPPVQKQLPAIVELLAKACVDHLEDLMGGETISLPRGRAVQYNNTLYITNSDVVMSPDKVDMSKLTVVTVDPSTME